MFTLLAAISLAASPAPTPVAIPALTPPQAEALRCGVAFALAARMQADRNPQAAAWPPLGSRGKEYFVRVTAKLMDDTGASREALSWLASREVAPLQAPGAVAAAMPACLALLTAAEG